MKRNIILLFFFLATLIAKGQVFENIGIKAGCSVANQKWAYSLLQTTTQKDDKLGIYCVLTTELFKRKYMSLFIETGYVQKGSQEEVEVTTNDHPEGTGEYETFMTSINYLEFSPQLKVHYQIKSFTPYLVVGPRLDYQVGFKSDIAPGMEKDLNKTIWGMTYGLGLEFRKNKFGILLEYQEHYNFSDVLDTRSETTNTGIRITGTAYVLSAGVKYYFHTLE